MQTKFKTLRIALLLALTMIVGAIQAQTISGHVKDATGEDVIGASVLEQGTKNGTVTDFNGNFTLKLTGKKAIVISYIGMKTQTVNIAGKTSVEVTLEDDNTTLQDVVVVGYGTMKKSDLTGAISSVSTEKLNAKGATTVMENLQGSVPGVNITQSSSRAGGGFDIEIRGKSTLGSNKNPLYVVDGVICDDINFLNPQDIERIDILKDASSTAIYGSRATNGVVIVTTKSAKEQGKKYAKPVIAYEGYYGITKAVRLPEFMDGSEFAQYRHFRYLNAVDGKGSTTLATEQAQNYWGMTPGNYDTAWLTRDGHNDSYIKDVINSGKETDWVDLFTRTASQQNHFLSVSGNGGNVNYHFGFGYQNEEGIYVGDKMDRFNLKGTVDAKLNEYLYAGVSFNGAYTDNETIADNAISSAFRLNPVTKAYDDDGNVIINPGMNTSLGTIDNGGAQFTSTANPLIDLNNTFYNTKTYQMLANLYVELNPLKGLSLKTTFSPSYISSRAGQFEDVPSTLRGTTETSENRASTQNRHKFSWTWDNQVNYNLKLNDHSIGLMGLFSSSSFNQETYYQEVYGVPSTAMWWNAGQATGSTTVLPTSGYTEWSMLSYAGRLNYSYKDRYLLTATVRWDGSSRFADGHRWGSFPSAALAWRITEEDFMASTKSWLSNLKLRASFGVTGNNYTEGSNYATQVVATGGSYFYGFSDGTGKSVYYPSGIVNQNLTWEKTTEYNIGLDFGFLNGRINGSIDWYNKTSKDLLMSRQLAYEAGGATVIDNIGKVKNTGIEISLTTVNIQNKDWNWTTSVNFSHNHNEILEVNGGTEDDIANSFFVGESINALYNYTWSGIVSDQSMIVPDTKIARDKGFTPGESVLSRDYYFNCYGWTEGMPIIDDLNGDGAIDQKDKSIIGKSNPTWTGSFNSSLSWKNIDFSFSIYTKQDYKVYSPFYKQYTNYGDRGMQHINMDFYIPDGTLLSCDYDENGNRINEVYQEGTHYGSYPFPNNGVSTGAGAGTYAFSSNAKDGADNMNSMKTANSKGAPYQVVDASYWKVKNISLGYTFPKSILEKTKVVRSLRLYVNITNPFVFGTDYKGYDPEWAGASLSAGGISTTTYQFGASIKF